MSKRLKNFFRKNKTDVKFKNSGHPTLCLNDESVAENSPQTGESSHTYRVEPTDETKLAVSALLARFESTKTAITLPKNKWVYLYKRMVLLFIIITEYILML